MNWKRLLIGKWSWKRPFISLGSIYILLCLFAVFFADRMIFMPPDPNYADNLKGFTRIDSKKTGTIAAIHLKAKPGESTIIYSHGNAEDTGMCIDVIYALHRKGYGVIAYDYPGYGLSAGKPTESSTQEAIQATWDYAINSGIPESSIIILGQSIGSGPSVWLASHTKPAGLILISPLKSVYCVPFGRPIFPCDRFPNYKRIPKIHTPLLVIHSEQDEVIPFSHGKELFEISPASNKFLVPIKETGHNDMYHYASEEIFDAIDTFIKQLPKQ
jgi:abhydrolase domain-containing protein 17